MGGFRLVSNSIPVVADKTFSKKHLMLGRLLTDWESIVGSDLAARTQPARLRYSKPRDKSQKATATLDIAAPTAEAAQLHYRKDLILERINRLFGAGWISAIRFVPQEAVEQDRKRPTPRPTPLTPQQKTYLSSVTDGIADPDLRSTLETMGKALLQDRRNS